MANDTKQQQQSQDSKDQTKDQTKDEPKAAPKADESHLIPMRHANPVDGVRKAKVNPVAVNQHLALGWEYDHPDKD